MDSGSLRGSMGDPSGGVVTRDVEIDRDSDGKPIRLRFGAGDDLAGPFPAQPVAEVLAPRYVLADDEAGAPRLWHRHSTETDRDFGGLAGVCVKVRKMTGADEWQWIQADSARNFWTIAEAEAAWRAEVERRENRGATKRPEFGGQAMKREAGSSQDPWGANGGSVIDPIGEPRADGPTGIDPDGFECGSGLDPVGGRT